MSNGMTFAQVDQRMELLPAHVLDTQCTELPPTRTLMQGFLLPANQIIPSSLEFIDGLTVILREL